MAKQRSQSWKAVLCGLFTTVAAPLLVHFFTGYTLTAGTPSGPDGSLSATAASDAPASYASPASQEFTVVAQGTGWTVELAWDNAMHKALRLAADTVADNSRSADQERILVEAARSSIKGWQDLRCTREWGAWRREISVTIDRKLLAEKVKAEGTRVAMDSR